jgi:hypothetical protein
LKLQQWCQIEVAAMVSDRCVLFIIPHPPQDAIGMKCYL